MTLSDAIGRLGCALRDFRKEIYKVVIKECEKQVKKEFVKNHGFDIRCACCRQWFSKTTVLTGMMSVRQLDNPSVFGYTCPVCRHESFFIFGIAPIPLSCKEDGSPTNSGNRKIHK